MIFVEFLVILSLVHLCKFSYLQEVWSIEKNIIFCMGYARIFIQRPFLDQKKTYKKLLF
jgi:hypothetical protein